MRISLRDVRLRYTGRIDWRNPEGPEFIFPASSLAFRFRGKGAAIVVENRRLYWDNYVGAIIDGRQRKWKLADEGETRVVLLDEEDEGEHEVLCFKRQDGCHELVIRGLELWEGSHLLDLPGRPDRRIEIYGDSVSAGEVSEATEYAGMPEAEQMAEELVDYINRLDIPVWEEEKNSAAD